MIHVLIGVVVIVVIVVLFWAMAVITDMWSH